jgi:protein-S-isoprenylcysteine O-methyltransferase Ste14
MVLRAILAFIAMPGIVAGVIPLELTLSHDGPVDLHPVGLPLLGAGLAALLWCVRDFLVTGQGTLAPWDPPRRLVTTGLYRYSRNPMYVAVTIVLVGWALCFGLPSLWLYAGAVALAFGMRVILFEEPWLARTHGDEWDAYRRRVRRWI